MNRRDVLKGLAAIPFTGSIIGCEERSDDKSHTEIVEVHLDGAFALVIQENKGNSVLAFSPRPKPGDDQHEFYFNGSIKPEASGKDYRFTLSAEGLERGQKPEISPGLNDFFFKTDKWRVADSLVTIELPPPKRITFAGERTQVTFQSGDRNAFMPTNHILQYDTRDLGRVKLECSDAKLKCGPSLDSFPGVSRYFFEIGPKPNADPSLSRAHAIHFFNFILEQSFPELFEKFQLKEYPRGGKQASLPRVEAVVFQYQQPRLQRVSYAIDCEFGGPVVGTSVGPTK
jgi:hypothetical protein